MIELLGRGKASSCLGDWEAEGEEVCNRWNCRERTGEIHFVREISLKFGCDSVTPICAWDKIAQELYTSTY